MKTQKLSDSERSGSAIDIHIMRISILKRFSSMLAKTTQTISVLTKIRQKIRRIQMLSRLPMTLRE
jgi:hypothetical protein